MHITLLLGTARKEAVSRGVFEEIANRLVDSGVSFDAVKVGDIVSEARTVAPSDTSQTPAQAAWNAQVKKTDLFIMVLPEYNHSFPGEWKILMDLVAVKEYSGKQVAIATVSAGSFAGVRVMEHVLPVLMYLEFLVSVERLHIGNARELFQHGMLGDEHVSQRIDSFITRLTSS